MRKVLSVLFLLLFLTSYLPVSSEQKKPFLAVFATENCYRDWKKFKPDLYFQTHSFTGLWYFMAAVKEAAGDRPIIMDIECHGSEEGYLGSDINGSDVASFGYLVKAIDKSFHDNNKLTVLVEACHSQICIEKTLKVRFPLEGKTYHVMSFKGKVPWEMYGVGRSANYDNLMYLQYRYNFKLFYNDLRQAIGRKPEPADNSKDTDLAVKCLTALLEQFKP